MPEMSLLEFLFKLISDPDLQEEYLEDPKETLEEAGLNDLSAADVRDALILIQDNQTADFSREYDTGGNEIDFRIPPVRGARAEGSKDNDDDEGAVEYINRFVTTNYVDDRDVITDNSINQVVDTGGGDFDQELDIDSVVASGDGAVAAGGDIEDSEIVTGNDNQIGFGNVRGEGNVVGDGNRAVTGNGNTTAFGDGDANNTRVEGDVELGDGAAFSAGGNAFVNNTNNSVNDSFKDESERTTTDSFNTRVDIDESINDSFDDEYNTSIRDSGNVTDTRTIDGSFNERVRVEIDD